MDKKPRIVYLDAARAAAIVFISMNHAANRSFANYHQQYLDFTRYSMAANVFKSLATVISHFGVPLFLMITGALILNKSFDTKDQWKNFYRHNWLHLLITTEIWFAIMFWVTYFGNPDSVLRTLSIPKLIQRFFMTLCFVNQNTFDSLWYMLMIIPLYTILPAIAVWIKKGYAKALWIPALIVFVSSFFMPSFNGLLSVFETKYSFYFSLQSADVFSMYLLYILAGYYLSKIDRKKIKPFLLRIVWIALFAFAVVYQLKAYRAPVEYLLDYFSPTIFALSAILFVLIRHDGPKLEGAAKFFRYISKSAFAVYFVHIVIMELIVWNADLTAWNPVLKFFFLLIVSVGASFPIIALLSKNRYAKDYLFMIKD